MNIKIKTTIIHTINVRGQFCDKLRSRRVWEALFNHTEAKNFTKFDNFLIDLDEFAKQFSDHKDMGVISFYWVHWGNGDYTKVIPINKEYQLIDTWDGCYGIQFEQDAQLIKILYVEVLDNAE